MSDDPISFARDALERHAWKDAYEALIEADRTDLLSAAALEMLAWATYWTGRPDATIEALERAYAAYLDEGDRAQAAMMAYRLAQQHGMRMSIPPGAGLGAEGCPPRRGGCDLAGARLVALDAGPPAVDHGEGLLGSEIPRFENSLLAAWPTRSNDPLSQGGTVQ